MVANIYALTVCYCHHSFVFIGKIFEKGLLTLSRKDKDTKTRLILKQHLFEEHNEIKFIHIEAKFYFYQQLFKVDNS